MAGRWKAKWLAAVLSMGAVLAPCGEQGGPEGTAALREFLRVVPLDGGRQVVGLTGFDAVPRPASWLILVGPVSVTGTFEEFVFDGINVLARRTLSPLPGQEFPSRPLDLDRLRIPSDDACELVTGLARDRGWKDFTAHVQLRVREEGDEPVWMFKVLGAGRVEAGTVYVSAESGEVLRQSWSGERTGAHDKVSAR